MKISQYSIADLCDPATRRALSEETTLLSESSMTAQSQNPRAAAADLALLVARDGQEVVGVLGVVPDWIFLDDTRHRIGWMHNWIARAGGAGGVLLLAAARHYENGIGVSGCTPIAEKVYLGSRKLVELQRKEGASFFFHTDLARLVPARWPRMAGAAPILRIADRLLGAGLDVRIAPWRRRLLAKHDLRIKEVESFSRESTTFMDRVRWDELFRRGADELNWMKSFTERATGPRAAGGAPREHTFLEVRDGRDDLVGLAYLRLSSGTVKVPYFFAHADLIDPVAAAVLEQCMRTRARDLLVYSRPLADSISRFGPPTYAKKPRSKLFLIGTRFAGASKRPSCYIQDGDGDAFI